MKRINFNTDEKLARDFDIVAENIVGVNRTELLKFLMVKEIENHRKKLEEYKEAMKNDK